MAEIKTRQTVRLPPALVALVDSMAESRGISRNKLITIALEQHLIGEVYIRSQLKRQPGPAVVFADDMEKKLARMESRKNGEDK